MKKIKLRIFSLKLLIILILLLALIFLNVLNRWIITLIIVFCAFISYKFLKSSKVKSHHKKTVNFLMLIFSVIYLALLYLMGLYFGLVKSKILFSWSTVINLIIPLTLMIVSAEIIRNVFLSQELNFIVKKKEVNILPSLTFISMVLIDILMYTGYINFSSLDSILTAVGYLLFSSIANNLLFNYISVRYDYKGIIIFRLISTLYMYIIPIIPDVYMLMLSFYKMVFAYIIYLIIDKFFSKNDFVVSYSEKRRIFIGNTILMIFSVILIMMISCEFKYGMMVIGSKSMTGTLNKGDVVIYESYDDQIIKKGQVIIFNYNNIKAVHRVSKIVNFNGENRYYTKGDANKIADQGYTTEEDILGLVRIKIRYIGYPTLLLKDLFEE